MIKKNENDKSYMDINMNPQYDPQNDGKITRVFNRLNKTIPDLKHIPEYSKRVQQRFNEMYPNSNIPATIVNRIINLFWDITEELLLEGEEVHIYGHGRFKLLRKDYKGLKRFRLKFLFSQKAKRRVAIATNTATESELRAQEKDDAYIQEVWRHRIETNIKKTGELPVGVQEYYDRMKLPNPFKAVPPEVTQFQELADEILKPAQDSETI